MKQIHTTVRRTYAAGHRQVRRLGAHPAGLPAVLFGVLALLSGWALMYLQHSHARPVIRPRENYIVFVSHDGQKQTVPTNEATVGDVLRELRIAIRSGDRVEPDLHTAIVQDNLLVNVYRSVPITVADQSNRLLVQTAAATPRSKVAQSGVVLYPEDVVLARPVTNVLTQRSLSEQLVIQRATPVAMTVYGSVATVRTQARTVAALLQEKKIVLGKDDTVTPGLTAPLTPNMQVAVVRNGIQVITVDEDVAPPVQTVTDPTLSFGSQAVRQEGSPGKVKKTYEINVQEGREISRKLLQTVSVVEPVPRIVVKGKTVNIPGDKQAVLAAAGVNPSDYMYVDYIFSHESGWNAAVVSRNGYVGLGQTREATLAAACPNWQNDPVCQTQFFSRYAGRYGGWEGAYNAWQSKGWW